MATRQPREASAADVRQWALDTKWTDSGGNGVGERGRFSSELVEAFNKAHRRNNVVYQGGGAPSSGSGNSRSTTVATRTQSRASNSAPSTRRAPSGPARQEAAPRQRTGDVQAAVISPAGSGMSDEQMEQYTRMLADANAVTGQPMELTIVSLRPAAA